jgi:L-threonate 2-dehydrogenase
MGWCFTLDVLMISARTSRFKLQGLWEPCRHTLKKPIVAIVAQGAMGAGIGARLVEHGVTVLTTLAGRSDASVERARAAGMQAVTEAQCTQADFFLSICPPSEAATLAARIARIIAASEKKPVYVDCNAVSPKTKIMIGETLIMTGSRFVDVGIIGLPPKGNQGPVLHASGKDATSFGALNKFGIEIKLIDAPIGAASALKMSYAGITKGLMAMAPMMMLAASRAGVAQELHNELARTQASLLLGFEKSVPGMFDKAYRFVGEMREIADFAGDDPAARLMYEAVARFYTRIGEDHAGLHEETDVLKAFLKL